MRRSGVVYIGEVIGSSAVPALLQEIGEQGLRLAGGPTRRI
jgi:hypothetical protein